jgi:hypothetical protein
MQSPAHSQHLSPTPDASSLHLELLLQTHLLQDGQAIRAIRLVLPEPGGPLRRYSRRASQGEDSSTSCILSFLISILFELPSIRALQEGEAKLNLASFLFLWSRLSRLAKHQMLELVASHLRVQNRALAGGKAMKKLIWVDVGGGSGWNIEKMDQFMSIKDTFEAVYLSVSLSLSSSCVLEARC